MGMSMQKQKWLLRIGSVYVIVTKKRKPYHREFDFTRLGLNPRETVTYSSCQR